MVIADHGPGIDSPDREHVFDRFYRAESSRAVPGSGLGLAIVAQVVSEHKGVVSISDQPTGGAIVHVRLPANR
ncbi:sensor histidine kinase [Actinoplanes sp. CA-030573]|uniref:sensor histidine kinase n=1 Tax=Actinoplanes sp. CA-030573 TaxID=3239898 RepID=UPI003D8B1615